MLVSSTSAVDAECFPGFFLRDVVPKREPAACQAMASGAAQRGSAEPAARPPAGRQELAGCGTRQSPLQSGASSPGAAPPRALGPAAAAALRAAQEPDAARQSLPAPPMPTCGSRRSGRSRAARPAAAQPLEGLRSGPEPQRRSAGPSPGRRAEPREEEARRVPQFALKPPARQRAPRRMGLPAHG